MSIADSEKDRRIHALAMPGLPGHRELRIDSENINENFEVEKQTVITPCPRCGGTGFISPDDESTLVGHIG